MLLTTILSEWFMETLVMLMPQPLVALERIAVTTDVTSCILLCPAQMCAIHLCLWLLVWPL